MYTNSLKLANKDQILETASSEIDRETSTKLWT
jgi:hypothetical protein